jgi:hypothetical protein
MITTTGWPARAAALALLSIGTLALGSLNSGTARMTFIGQARANETDAAVAKAQPAVNAYYSCLLDRAGTLARVSSEPAEVVAMAAIEACRAPRARAAAAFATPKLAGCALCSGDDGRETMDVYDKIIAKRVILRIIETRASAPTPSAPASTKPADTPL